MAKRTAGSRDLWRGRRHHNCQRIVMANSAHACLCQTVRRGKKTSGYTFAPMSKCHGKGGGGWRGDMRSFRRALDEAERRGEI